MTPSEVRAVETIGRQLLAIGAERDALKTRLIAAEKLLHDAEAVIEILLGDGHHKHAEEVVAAIATHWNTYPEPLA